MTTHRKHTMFAKRTTASLAALIFLLSIVLGTVSPLTAYAFAGGDGSEESPYQISDCEQLQDVANNLAAHYVLANDIDCSMTNPSDPDWNDTGRWADSAGFVPILSFVGNFDGDNHTISGLFIDRGTARTGLFGSLDMAGRISNLELTDATIMGSDYAAALVGYSYPDTEIENITINATVDGDWCIGGVVGKQRGLVENVTVGGEVHGESEVGGVTGCHISDLDTIIDAHSSVEVHGDYAVGGLAGSSFHHEGEDPDIIDSSASGDVYGQNSVGGFVGANISGGIIEDSSASGDVYAEGGLNNNIGGFVGENDEGIITRSSASGNVTVAQAGDGIDDGAFGGFAGSNEDGGSISESSSSGNVVVSAVGYRAGGGFVGELDNAIITESFATGNVSAPATSFVGGFVGQTDGSGDTTFINDSYARGAVAGNVGVGGLVGYNKGGIAYSYATGMITAEDDSGGLVGDDDGGTVESSFWDEQTTGVSTSSGGASPKSTDQMKQQATFTDTVNSEGLDEAWDFADVWGIATTINDGYPCLQWTDNSCAVDDSSSDGQDLNGDNIPDSEQPNVGGYTSPITGKTVAIDVGEGCELTTDDYVRESQLSVQDAAYDYANGLWDFEADCGTAGHTTTVKLYYYDVTPDSKVLRKHNPTTNAFFTITDATIATQTINAHSVTVVTYHVTDGGERDTDGTADGNISDPAGLAAAVVGAPSTGLQGVKK